MKRLVASLLCLALCCAHTSARTAEPAAPAFDRPCAKDSASYAEAAEKIQAVDQQIRALKPESDHRPANDALIALFDHECMKLASVDKEELRAEAAPALIEFWTPYGADWAEGVLDLAKYRWQFLPAPMRKVLAPETRPDFQIPALLCPLGDDACGRETLGWWRRAETFFKLNEQQGVLSTAEDGDHRHVVTQEECRTRALAKPPSEQYDTWQLCVYTIPNLRYAMPLGRLRAPTSGWLIVRLGRGRVSLCDVVGMFSLATGSAYRGESCDAWPRVNDKAEPTVKLTRGAVNVENLREFVWYDLQREQVIPRFSDMYHRNPNTFTVPDGVPLMKVSGSPALSKHPGLGIWTLISSGYVFHNWTLVSETGQVVANGVMRSTPMFRPPVENARIDYAVELWQIAEAAFVEGCPQERPPAAIDADQGKSVDLTQVQGQLIAELQRIAKTGCTPKR